VVFIEGKARWKVAFRVPVRLWRNCVRVGGSEMIEFVLNGYYRSGTTVLYRAIRATGYTILYEPLAPVLLKEAIEKHWINSRLHGASVGTEYMNELKDHLDKLQELHMAVKLRIGGDNTPLELYPEVAAFFDYLHDLDMKLAAQPNNCHFILKAMKKRYGCETWHIVRNPIDTWIAMVLEPPIGGAKGVKERMRAVLYEGRTTPFARVYLQMYNKNAFFLNETAAILRQRYKIRGKTQFDKFLHVWTYCNYEACKQADHVLYYEQIVKNPKFWYEKLTRERLPLSWRVMSKLSPDRITRDEKMREIVVKKLAEFNLLSMVNEFYPPEEWF
jgi:hypothetical protein